MRFRKGRRDVYGAILPDMVNTSTRRFSDLVAVKIERSVANELRRLARADDRTLSAFVRRILTNAVTPDAASAPSEHH